MTSQDSPTIVEKLVALLQSAASMGMTASLNLDTRNGKICTTFSCEELRVPDGKPSSKPEKKRQKSKGSIKRSKERLLKYQENKRNCMDNKIRLKEQTQKVKECDRCNYKCTRLETMENHMKNKHMEIHKLEQNELQKSNENSNKSIEELMAAFEEEKQKDIQSHKDIEQLLKECEEDMRDDTEDDEVYSESESED